jgi:hypothetical protein
LVEYFGAVGRPLEEEHHIHRLPFWEADSIQMEHGWNLGEPTVCYLYLVPSAKRPALLYMRVDLWGSLMTAFLGK